MGDARAAGGIGRMPLLSEYSCRQNETPSWDTCCFVFGRRLGLGYPVGAHSLTPALAVRSNSWTALHLAAAVHGNRRIVRLLIDANAVVDARNCAG